MKKSDLSIVILVASISVIIAYVTAKTFIADGGGSVRVQHAQTIETEVGKPDATIFNENAINPTVEVRIGQ